MRKVLQVHLAKAPELIRASGCANRRLAAVQPRARETGPADRTKSPTLARGRHRQISRQATQDSRRHWQDSTDLYPAKLLHVRPMRSHSPNTRIPDAADRE